MNEGQSLERDVEHLAKVAEERFKPLRERDYGEWLRQKGVTLPPRHQPTASDLASMPTEEASRVREEALQRQIRLGCQNPAQAHEALANIYAERGDTDRANYERKKATQG